ncbi:structural maintenance of chromosomes protein 6-like isoform X3 [Lytechinus variegatus]|uniref:structural maintenance of chromosomes protein 6-like isoform X3 n=1 Tax=Lytechinus variegatus TaxID=7654 RepID=UPI001BB158A4|nr:structural maintenance of chromosomes protein 6-like isoform X3 [Lytechinus variegatus]
MCLSNSRLSGTQIFISNTYSAVMPKHKSNLKGGPKHKRAHFPSTQSDLDEEIKEGKPSSQSQNTSNQIEHIEAGLGIIEKISLQNFMCHERLECSFGPHMNFVIGCNGSGKSAMLMAIIVGLGGRPIVHGCGVSFHPLVKAGKDVAEICIKLRNRGDDAYRPEVYGPSITVMTRIHKYGNTTYTVMLADGEFVSSSDEDVSDIVKHLKIQVDNPLTFMDEETSKKFLLKQSAKDMYKFFLKTTQLEETSRDDREIKLNKETIEDLVIKLNEKLPLLERELRNLTHLQDLTERKEPPNQSPLEPGAEPERLQDNVKRVQERRALIQCQGEILRQRLGDLSPKLDQANNHVEKLKTIVKSLEMEIKLVTPLIRGEGSDESNVLPRIRVKKERDSEQFEEERVDRERRITALVEEKRHLEAQMQDAVKEVERSASAVNSAQKRIYGLQFVEGYVLTQAIHVASGERRLKNLEGSRKNRLKLYGDYMPNLLAEIERSAARFHQTPLGPVGSFLKLKDVRWALGVESCLKRLLYSFCCHDQHDLSILKDIMNRVIPQNAPHPSIITSKFEPHTCDISRAKVQSRDFPSFLDIVDISHPVIFNALVDLRGVESILLIEKSKDARGYMSHQLPTFCREAFTMDGDQVFIRAKQRLSYYPSKQRNARVLRDADDEISETRRDLNQNQRALIEIMQQVQALRQDVSENENLMMTAQQQRMKLEDEIGKINNQINQLEAEETNVADLEEEVQQMEAKINERKEKLESFSKNFKEGRRQLAEASQQFKVVDDQIQELSYQVDPLKVKIEPSDKAYLDEEYRKRYAEKKKELMEELADLQKEVDETQSKIEETMSKVRQLTGHQDNTALDNDGDIQEVPEDAIEQGDGPQMMFASIQKQIKGLTKTVENVNKLIDRCDMAKKDTRHYIAQRTKYYFITMMSALGYLGRLKFDHPKEELVISVESEQMGNVKDVSVKNIKSLSRGERLLSTLTLILALGASVESPIRVLDGFDNLMDMVNRKIFIDLLLQHVREEAARQFIIFTPVDVGVIPSEFVHITRLEGPGMNSGHIKEEQMEEQD